MKFVYLLGADTDSARKLAVCCFEVLKKGQCRRMYGRTVGTVYQREADCDGIILVPTLFILNLPTLTLFLTLSSWPIKETFHIGGAPNLSRLLPVLCLTHSSILDQNRSSLSTDASMVSL